MLSPLIQALPPPAHRRLRTPPREIIFVSSTKLHPMKTFKLLLVAMTLLTGTAAFSQTQTTIPYFTYGKGLGITSPDSLFSMTIRFRIQNRAAFETLSEDDFEITKVEARVRRMRLRFDGFVYSPKLTYVIQLSFSRGDMDYESLGFPNIIRDAYIQYAVSKSFLVGIGQTKLPGNRQRVNSSGDLQLADRSIVNSVFNIDRDFGVQATFRKNWVIARAAISSGEGRNINSSDNGLAYTGRVEFLPFGSFTNGGEYFEGDLMREQKPKLSIGIGYSHNENAVRTGGQLGSMLAESTDIKTQMADLLFKHNGWSFAAEYLHRIAPKPISTDENGETSYVYVGHGQNYQGGYLFKNNFELVGRYSVVTPDREISSDEIKKEQYTLGVNKYIKGHRVKIQSDVTLEQQFRDTPNQFWIYRFQVEVGI
jgi:phosphate-selective porin OprO/OprP